MHSVCINESQTGVDRRFSIPPRAVSLQNAIEMFDSNLNVLDEPTTVVRTAGRTSHHQRIITTRTYLA